MINSFSKFLTKYKPSELGHKSFLIGIFFLPSAIPISGIFLLISLIIALKKDYFNIFNIKLHFPIFLSIGLIIFSCINITFIDKPYILNDYDVSLVWLNLFNWLPIFFFYLGFQTYLKTIDQKTIFAKYLISGTFPVVISFILQKFLNLYGPFKTFFGLIVWFQKPISNDGAMTGLFSNPNYAAIWLVLVLPFAIVLFKKIKNSYFQKIILLIYCLFLFYTILLTGSRNGILGILITIVCLFGIRKLILISTILFSFFTLSNYFNFLIDKESILFKIFNPSFLINKFTEISIYNFPRFEIWNSTIGRIIERPFLGWGPSTFPFLHLNNNYAFIAPKKIIDAQHSHNIVLEFAHNFGIPLAVIILSMLFFLTIKSYKYIFLNYQLKNDILIQRAWFASSLTVFISHLSDITLYDGKILILISILFAGLKCIIIQGEIKDY